MASEQGTSKTAIERLLSFGTVFLAFIYGTGFLVVSIHHAQYGLPFFEFLRARSFAAGALLSMFVVLPIVAASRTFSLFGLRMPIAHKQVVEQNLTMAKICVVCGFSSVGFVLASALGPLFPWGFQFVKSPLWLAVSLVVDGLCVVVYRRYINTYPVFTLVVNVIGLPISLTAMWKAIDHGMFFISMWFYVIGLIFVFWHSILRLPDAIRRTDIERNAPVLFCMILVFAVKIYGTIEFAWGGGMLVPVTVYFTRPTSFSSSTNAPAYLVEETDKGFYLTHKPEEKKASYVPREAVASIDFTSTKN